MLPISTLLLIQIWLLDHGNDLLNHVDVEDAPVYDGVGENNTDYEQYEKNVPDTQTFMARLEEHAFSRLSKADVTKEQYDDDSSEDVEDSALLDTPQAAFIKSGCRTVIDLSLDDSDEGPACTNDGKKCTIAAESVIQFSVVKVKIEKVDDDADTQLTTLDM